MNPERPTDDHRSAPRFPSYGAFVVQLDAASLLATGPAAGLTGRVEHVVSGETSRFVSLAELDAFLRSTRDEAATRSDLTDS